MNTPLPRGATLLHDPLLNKGTAFTELEREAFGLRGLLPPNVTTLDDQVKRCLENIRRLANPLEKYIALSALHDRNETLFFRVVSDNPDEMMPIIYTPTVGLACENYGHIFRKSRGMYIGANDRGRIASILKNWPYGDVRIIVVTDGERILGLGDLGANGMGIPVGKLSLYTACAGIAPEQTLPIMLDVGTNNAKFIDDPLYIGLKQKRVTGQAYDDLLEEFVTAANEVFPGVLVQFEDFANHNAFRLLDRYRERVCCFNDDIQGTASVALAGLLSALRITGRKLQNEKILFLGAGEAATGIADLIVSSMVAHSQVGHEARRRNWLFDSKGLVVKSRKDLPHHKLPYAHDHPECTSFLDAIKAIRPTAIIGVAGMGGAFTPEVLRVMADLNARPIIFALSNPTSKAECTASEAYEHTGGRALFACGSPFDPVNYNGQKFVPRQGNNSYIFPGVGLGVIACGARRVTEGMFLAAANALVARVSEADLAQGSLYPPLASIREVSAYIATAVADVAYREGIATVAERSDLLGFIKESMYQPRYTDYLRLKG